jgi:ATP-dependent RNA helicase DDX46/PRP5
VTASFYPLDAFLAGDLGHEGAVVQQTAITWEDIVAMNSRPASSWDTMANAALPASGLGSSSAAAMEVDDATPATNVEGASAVELPPPAASTAAASSSATAETETSAAAAGIPATAAVAAEPEALEEPSNFHAEFMRAMRAQAAEAARQAAHASQELLEGRDDAMDALVEEFPEAAEHVEAPEGEDEEEDEEDRALAARAKKKELPKIDHSTVEYAPFRKNFYVEVPEISNMSEEQVEELRKSLDSIKVRGKRCPRPIKRWTQCGLSDRLLGAIAKAGYGKPFPIQAQSLPAIMSGRDVIGIAKTGSGKTMGYALPLLRHVMDQPALAPGDGPIGLVMVPTRELAMQVYREVAKFAKVVGLATVAVYGGADLKAQIAELKRGAEIVVCTPGRMIDMLTANSGRVTNLRRATYVVRGGRLSDGRSSRL